jgi:putative DNA primase/helicase
LKDGERIPEGSRDTVLTSFAGSMRRRGMGESAIHKALAAENEERCDPPLPEEQVAKIARSVATYEPEDPVRPGADTNGQVHLTDRGNAMRLVRDHGADLLHCRPWRQWLIWDGCRWTEDHCLQVTWRLKKTLIRLFQWTVSEMQKIGGTIE